MCFHSKKHISKLICTGNANLVNIFLIFIFNNSSPENRIWEDLPWTTCTINFAAPGTAFGVHIDLSDIPGCSAIFLASNYLGGDFINVTRRIRYRPQQGQVVLTNSCYEFHGFIEVLSKRTSIAFYTDSNILNHCSDD